jgi:hypothetical protein
VRTHTLDVVLPLAAVTEASFLQRRRSVLEFTRPEEARGSLERADAGHKHGMMGLHETC